MSKQYRRFSSAKPRKPPNQVMHEFLKDCLQPSGRIEINQPRQSVTWVRALNAGLISESGELLDAGRDFLKKMEVPNVS